MKAIEKLGGWILDTRAGLIVGCLLLLGIIGIGVFEALTGPKTVTISAKEYYCAESEPDGIGSRCINYRRAH